jgi:hypothetical protein
MLRTSEQILIKSCSLIFSCKTKTYILSSDRIFMKVQTRKIILYVAGIFLLISGILGILMPQLGFSTFTSVVWTVLGAVFVAIGYGTNVRKIVIYAAGIFLFISGILGILMPQLGLSTINSLIWIALGILFIYISYTYKY